MGHAVDEARQERELTKQHLSANLERLEAKVRAELDWRTRLRRNGIRYAAGAAGVIALLAALLVLRSKLRRGDEPHAANVASLDDIAAELDALHEEIRRLRKRGDQQPMWQKLALRAVTAAAAAAGTKAARGALERFGNGEPEAGYPDDDEG